MKYDIHLAGQTFQVDSDAIPGEPVAAGDGTVSLLYEGRSYTLHVRTEAAGGMGNQVWIAGAGAETIAEVLDPRRLSASRGVAQAGRVSLKAPMAGKVVRLLTEPGATLEAGQGVLVLEAMKMQNEVRSPKAGVVSSLNVSAGQVVATGELLAEID